MSGLSTSAVRGPDVRTYIFKQYSGRQFNRRRKPQSPVNTGVLPSQEKIYRSRMTISNGGSKYDCRLDYPSDNVLAKTSIRSNTLHQEDRKDRLASPYTEALIEEQSDAQANFRRWLLWVRHYFLQPIDNILTNLNRCVNYTLEDLSVHLQRAEAAFEEAQYQAQEQHTIGNTTDIDGGKWLSENFRRNLRLRYQLIFGWLFSQLLTGVAAEENVLATATTASANPLANPDIKPLTALFTFLFLSITSTITFPFNLIHYILFVLTSPFWKYANEIYIFIRMRPEWIYFKIHLTLGLITITVGWCFFFGIVHLLHFIVQFLLWFLGWVGQLLPHSFQFFIFYQIPLYFRWCGLQVLRALVWLLTLGLDSLGSVLFSLHRAFCIACETCESWIGVTAGQYYASVVWNSALMHQICGTLRARKVWVSLFVGLLALNWAFVCYQERSFPPARMLPDPDRRGEWVYKVSIA